MKISRSYVLCILLLAQSAVAQETAEYTNKAGSRVDVFEHETLNYRLDLSAEAYTYVDFSAKVPDASFAAIRFKPNAFSLIVVEDIGLGVTADQYAEAVQSAMEDKFETEIEGEFKGYEDIGARDERGMGVFQKKIYTVVESIPITYVITTYVDGPRAYQLLTFASEQPDEVIQAEADLLLGGFSVIDARKNQQVVVDTSNFKDYRSATFGYRFRARDRGWYGWSDLSETNEGADFGALAARGYGTAVMPMCWEGARPTNNAIYRVMMQQFGEDYPSDFITEELDIEKDGATGKLLIGREENEGELYIYYQWIVANEHCSYTLAAWGAEDRRTVQKDLEKLWKDFEITGSPTALASEYSDQAERDVNAYLVNAIGLHYYDARSFRDAFDYFQQANELVPDDEAYIVNAARALVEIDAFREAADWIEPRTAPFADNLTVQSWDAWLAYQTDNPERALRIYDSIFDTDYRDNTGHPNIVRAIYGQNKKPASMSGKK